jgi:hypothetical protein
VSTTAENLDWEEKKQNFMESLGTHHEVVEDCFLNQREKYIKCTKRILLLFRRVNFYRLTSDRILIRPRLSSGIRGTQMHFLTS